MINIIMSTKLGHLDQLQQLLLSSRVDQSFDFISILPPSPAASMECPRCGSINTKFCYYNNYSKTQPRHYCKACKRHWTKGGTLRNVPTGAGGRRSAARKKHNNNNNKRQKKKKQKQINITTTTTETPQIPDPDPDPLPFHKFSYDDQSSTIPLLLDNLGGSCFNASFGNLMDIASSGLNLDLSQQQFSFSSLSSFENNPISSLSTNSTSADTYNYAERIHAGSSVEDSSMMGTAAAAFVPQPWANCWNLEDIDTLVTSHDQLNILNWDESPPAPLV